VTKREIRRKGQEVYKGHRVPNVSTKFKGERKRDVKSGEKNNSNVYREKRVSNSSRRKRKERKVVGYSRKRAGRESTRANGTSS